MEYEISELQRRFENLIRIGRVSKIHEKCTHARVKMGDLETSFLPISSARAYGDVESWSLEVGEQVIVLCPSGELSNGIIISSLYQKDYQPEPQGHIHKIVYSDGTSIQYDKKEHALSISIPENGRISLSVNGNVSLEAKGDVSVKTEGTASVQAKTVKLNTSELEDFGVVTTGHICHFTGTPHGDGSKKVKAGH
jgi:phage baseplate assembly protein V